jgi:thioredoxin-related protein
MYSLDQEKGIRPMRRLQAFIAILILSALCASAASTFELVMFRRDGCPWCAAWDRELGPIYGKTEIGQRVPIRSVDVSRLDGMKITLKSPVRFTPTFVLLDGDREIGRIEGYPGPDFFWGLLENLVSKSGAAPGERRVPAGYWSLRTNTDER